MENEIVMVVDTKKHRPACVLLQAAFGCGDANGFMQSIFDARTWLVAPTDDMRRIAGTKEQWRAFAKQANDRHAST